MITISPSQNWAPTAAHWLHDAAALDAILRDPQRLAAAEASGLAEMPVDEAFDALTRLASQLLGASASFLAVVRDASDDYVSHCGFRPPLSETRQWQGRTFCHYTLAAADTLVIEDTTAHAPWRDVPTVHSLGVRAYVGVPVRLHGQVIGSFCVIDQQPRAWTALQIDILQQLAASAEREISLRSALMRERQHAARAQRRARERAQALVALAQEVQTPLQALQLCTLQLRRMAADPAADGAWPSLAQRVSEAVALLRDSLGRNLRPLRRDSDPALQVVVQLDELAHTLIGLVQPLADVRGVLLVLGPSCGALAQLDGVQALKLVLHITLHALEQALPGQTLTLDLGPSDGNGAAAWHWSTTGVGTVPGHTVATDSLVPLGSDREDMLDQARRTGLALTLGPPGAPFKAALVWGEAQA